MPGRYLMVLPVPGYRAGDGAFEIESAFAEHLKMLRRKLGPLADTMTIVAPEFSPEERADMRSMTRIDEQQERIYFHPIFPASLGRGAYFWRLPRILATLHREIDRADVVHAGLSSLFRPFEFPALMMASALGKKTISVTDIDHRRSARMNYETGRWSRKEYLVTRLLHDRFAHLQQLIGVRRFSLVLLKGKQLADDYGQGRPNVKYFLDSAFAAGDIIPADRLQRKLDALLSGGELRVVYFGRLVEYKGVDHMLRAVRRARDLGAPVRFDVIGDGPAADDLRALALQLQLGGAVAFLGSLPYGPALFDRLYDAQVLLAAPLSEDTPRSALDAFAMGQAIVAYDTYYYRELSAMGAPVDLVPWRGSDQLGRSLFDLHRDRQRLQGMIRSAVDFARDNPQETWLDRRVTWTRELFGAGATGAAC